MEAVRGHTDSNNIKVICRFRPLNAKQKQLGVQTVQQIVAAGTVKVRDPKVPDPLVVNLDRIFDMDSTQEGIYEIAGRPVVNSVLQGFNGTIFAYGQTSSGKTYTMQGYDIEHQANKGIVPRMIQQVFNAITMSPENIEFRLKVSIVELYMEKVRDLLDISKHDLKIRSHAKKGIYIEDVTEKYVSDSTELYALMQIGNKNRVSCSTNMNQRSSRSHMVFLITIAQSNLTDLSAKTGKLFLVDLAGSEKISKTGAEGKVLDEAKKINLSLTTLGKVIKALTESKSNAHVPYRQSKLTRILQESLGGNSRTTLIITCSPHPSNLQQTISTLRFGISAKKITNKAKINRQLTVGELQILLDKSDKELTEKKQIIEILEKYIMQELGAQLPSYTAKMKEEFKKMKEVEEHKEEKEEKEEEQANSKEPSEADKQPDQTSEPDSDINKTNTKSFMTSATINNDQLDQRVRMLQLQLDAYKSLLQKQTQKLHNLRVDYNALTTTTTEYEKQNTQLKQQVAKLKLEKQKIEQKRQDEALLQMNTESKSVAAAILSEVLNLVKPEERRDIVENLKRKKWYGDVEAQSVGVQSFWEEEKTKLVKELQAKIEKVNLLERNLEIENSKSKIRALVDPAPAEDLQKYRALQKTLEDLYSQFYEMSTLQSTWKAQCQLYERKLSKKCKQVKELEELILELKQEIDTFKEKECDFNSVIQVTGSKLVKPIRGGNKIYQFK